MKRKRPIRIGLDFDGVVAYNPFRIVRAPIKWFKKNILGINRLTFFKPKNEWQQFWWIIVHESSVWPANGVDKLRELVKENKVEVHLVTARYSFLRKNLFGWLKKNNLEQVFTSININEQNEQPHLFKEKVVNKYKFDYFIEDNLDIVEHLAKKCDTKILWIYNILDSLHKYPHKFPFLKKALDSLQA
jgi:uncharacterized HAD superfamily protein